MSGKVLIRGNVILGSSGTGKLFGLKQVLTKLQNKSPVPTLYTINVKDQEYAKDFKKHQVIGFDKIL